MTTRVSVALAGLAVALLSFSVLPTRAGAQGPPGLFGTAVPDAALAAGDADGPVVIRGRVAVLRLDALDDALAAGMAGDRVPAFVLNLFDDATYGVEFERFEQDAFGHRSWVGRVVGERHSTVTLTWRGDVVSGGVHVGDAVYRLHGAGGLARIEQLDPGSFGEELPPLVPPVEAMTLPAAADPLPPAAGEVVDVFVYYTAAARAGAGGATAIEALIAQGVAESNTVFTRSGVQASIRLAGTAELAGFVESTTSMSQDLNAFTSHATVAATRNAVNADLMHLVVANTTANVCGIAWLGPSSTYAHGVTARACFAQFTFTHEAGHNFGNQHAPEDPVSTYTFRPYSFGYKNCGAGTRFRTVMAYACSGVSAARILNLSNPGIAYAGLPTGTSLQNNALSQSEAFPIVQGFRVGAPPSLPGAPVNVQAMVNGNTLTVSWRPPSTGTPISTYIVQAGTAAGASNVFSGGVGPVTSVASPVANGTYYIRVIAQNVAGTGPASAEVVAQVGPPPGPPRDAAASVAGNRLTLSWLPPNTGGAVTGYVVQAGTTSGAANVFNGAVGAATSVSAPLPAGTYHLRVLATGPGGASAPSNETTAAVPACTVPAAPVLAGGRTGSVITVQWNTPVGGPVTGYTVQAGSTPGASNLYNAGVGLVNTVSATVVPGTYHVRVVAQSACGASAASNEVVVGVP